MNQKGSLGFLLFFFLFAGFVIVAGLIALLVNSVTNLTVDKVSPVLNGFGVVGEANTTIISQPAVNSLNALNQGFIWLIGLGYFVMILFLVIFAVVSRGKINAYYSGVYILFAVALIIVSIIFSNVYQDMASGSDEFSNTMKEYSLLGFLILHSPSIFSFVFFVAGILLFSGIGREQEE